MIWKSLFEEEKKYDGLMLHMKAHRGVRKSPFVIFHSSYNDLGSDIFSVARTLGDALIIKDLFACWHRDCLRGGDRKTWNAGPLCLTWACFGIRGIGDLLKEGHARMLFTC